MASVGTGFYSYGLYSCGLYNYGSEIAGVRASAAPAPGNYIFMAHILIVRYSHDLHINGLCRSGLYSYCLYRSDRCSSGLWKYVLYSCDIYSYGLFSCGIMFVVCLVLAYTVIADTGMAYAVICLNGRYLCSYGLYRYGLYSCGLFCSGLYSYILIAIAT